MQKHQVLIISEGKLIGPFPSQEIAQGWIDAPHHVDRNYEMYSIWEREPGTAETAHECGSRLVGIDEATKQTGRKTAGA